MDSYLDIAAHVLRQERRPLGPRTILAFAYRMGLVGPHLHGKTQHKTLQARISEDIIARREQSLFFRPEPGLFFLREFLSDATIPERHRTPMVTRRRVRDLIRGPALAIRREHLRELGPENHRIENSAVMSLLHSGQMHYGDPKYDDQELVFIWSFVSVTRANQVLSYRQGRYRETRDAFAQKRTIGFSTLVHEKEGTLFNLDDLGIVDSGVHATMLDLDVPDVPVSTSAPFRAHLKHFQWQSNSQAGDLLAVIDFECPDWFEPLKRRLAINDLQWLDLSIRFNDLDDFDPWSRSVMLQYMGLREGLRHNRYDTAADRVGGGVLPEIANRVR